MTLEARDLAYDFGSGRGVANISFTARSGRVLALLGPNGSGKSTAVRLLTNLLPGRGEVLFDGVRLTELRASARRVGVMSDGVTYDHRWTPRDYLAVVAASARIDTAEVRRTLRRHDLASIAGRTMGALSVGQTQRVKLAAALLGAPAVLILDEPLNGIDVLAVQQAKSRIRAVAHRGGTVVMTSHQLHYVEELADDVVILRDGVVIVDEEISVLLTRGSPTPVTLHCDDPIRLTQILRMERADVEPAPGGTLRVRGVSQRDIARSALTAGILIDELGSESRSLEQSYVAAVLGTAPTQAVAAATQTPSARRQKGRRGALI